MRKPTVKSLFLSMVLISEFKSLLPFLPVGILTNSKDRVGDTKLECALPPDGLFGSMVHLDVAHGAMRRLRSMV